MRLPRISLAVKYRILFGIAVVLIVGAALFVPWSRMEQLAWEQHFREAQRIADSQFIELGKGPGGGEGHSAGAHGAELTLAPDRAPARTKFVRWDLKLDDPESALQSGATDPFAARALRSFLRKPSRESNWSVERDTDGLHFRLARAVWAKQSCLRCHTDGGPAAPYRENQLAGVITVDLPTSMSESGIAVNRVVIVAAGALAGVLAILVFYIIVRRFILSPIDELRDVAARVTAGDLAVRARVATGDEFEQLSNSLNTMLERLRASQEELQRANRLLDEKLLQMAETNVALFEANRVKSEFIANVSHELRTPLTSIIGFAELLREGPHAETNSRTSRYAENILISGRILLEIINDLLDLAKIEAGKIELRIEPINLEEMCTTLLDFVRPLADKKNVHLESRIDDDLPVVSTDRGRLRQVLFNFLSNAIKFTPDGGQVTLAAERDGDDRVRMAVSDTGPGISREHQALIFDKFRQIDSSPTREHHGTGLGLAIAKELTYLLNGDIGVESELGHGAAFWVCLPVGAPQPRERMPVSLV
jgi:signal transduction histidine kinase